MNAMIPGYPADFFGALEIVKAREKLAIDDIKALALIECAGEVFYLNVAKSLGNPEAKALVTKSGNEERGHAHRLLKAIKLLGGEFTLPENDQNPLVASVMAEYPVNVEFMAMLVAGEKDGDLMYQRWAAVETNPEVAKIYLQNGKEETLHSERATQVIQMLGGS
jgi:rubrerythrin